MMQFPSVNSLSLVEDGRGPLCINTTKFIQVSLCPSTSGTTTTTTPATTTEGVPIISSSGSVDPIAVTALTVAALLLVIIILVTILLMLYQKNRRSKRKNFSEIASQVTFGGFPQNMLITNEMNTTANEAYAAMRNDTDINTIANKAYATSIATKTNEAYGTATTDNKRVDEQDLYDYIN